MAPPRDPQERFLGPKKHSLLRIPMKVFFPGDGAIHIQVMELHLGSNWCLPGVGDTGAHLSIIIDAGWPIFVLSHWRREPRAVLSFSRPSLYSTLSGYPYKMS